MYDALRRVYARTDWSDRDRVLALGLLMSNVFAALTQQEQIAFSTLFARISYVGHAHQLPQELVRELQHFRQSSYRIRQGMEARPAHWKQGLGALARTIEALTSAGVPPDIAPLVLETSTPDEAVAVLNARAAWRVVAVDDRPEQQYLMAYADDTTAQRIRILYGLPDLNDNFMPTIQAIRRIFGFPVTLQLLEVAVDDDGNCRPKGLVVEPDYLIDVSAVAECFKAQSTEPLYNLVKKFLPYETTPAILLGNVANHFLDRLLQDPEVDFDTLFRETFALYPLVYAPMDDENVRSLGSRARRHFTSLQQMAREGFARQHIQTAEAVLEPSFFSAQYGLQGRLDLFHINEERASIVELKSGQPFFPNGFGISRNHFTQALLYDLLTRSVYRERAQSAKYILYSGVEENPLRFAPTVEAEQWEAVQVRNQLVAIERLLTGITPGQADAEVFNRLTGNSFAGMGYLSRDMSRFESAYAGLSSLERAYMLSFTGFIAREHWLARCGVEGSDQIMGQAARWRQSRADKEQSFSILQGLKLLDNRANSPDPELHFLRGPDTNPLANFRTGDIAVLYPIRHQEDNVLHHQVIKCSITHIDRQHVTVALRYRQSNPRPFAHEGYWALEPDMLDNGFISQYRSLFEWMCAPPDVRARVLDPGSWPLDHADITHPPPPLDLTAEQVGLLQKMTGQRGYFFLWGPPGTGKTSVMLRAYVQWVLEHTSDNILLMAYTNRAVDEMCEALESIGPELRQQYWRIGSRHSTDERYREQLLQRTLAGARSRAALLASLRSRRIILSTVASFSQYSTLLDLHPCQRLVIDEASQLLEPQLIGLLTRFRTAVLIGDHQQLPAVVAQSSEASRVTDSALISIGLVSLADSYFERLYKRCLALNRTDHFGQLSQQGRMHALLMDFPNHHFYQGSLQVMENDAAQVQRLPIPEPLPEGQLPPCPAGMVLPEGGLPVHQRSMFIPAPTDDTTPGYKTSRSEAMIIVWLLQYFCLWYRARGLPWIPGKSLGIITPWRAQIAQIRQVMEENNLNPEDYTIDTVERYQGGARDIILMSCCVQAPFQLQSLVSLSADGVDRKLNVALTRARSFLVVTGVEAMLLEDPRYRAFIQRYRVG